MAPDTTSPTKPSGPDDEALEAIVAEFLLEREEGRKPSIDDYLTRYPRHAEALAQLLSYDTHPPARRDSTRSRGAGAPPGPTRPTTARGSDPGRIGPYELIDHVSTAGGGTVYRARHRQAGHVVALKVLDTRGAVDPRDLERFKREAAMLRAMNLVDVVPVLETGDDAGRFWIAMKWLEGDTFSKLRDAAREKAHPLHDARERARLVARVARTFAAIHGYGILHRDVKPSNLMIDRTGEPMIIDFGIAHAPDLPELTATTDQIMGTPRYLAPELLSGGNREVSPRTDVYGLGLCLYELCTGVEAFRQSMRADLFTAIRTTGPVPPRKANPAVSEDLSAVILRALEIDPARRYPDMTSFAEDLDRVARGESPHPTTLRGANPVLRAIRRNKKALIATACLAAVLIPAIWLVANRGLDEVRARDLESRLRPFAFFSPEAFADGKGLPSRWDACAMEGNPAATASQRLVAAWIPFLTGNVADARSILGDEPGSTFAARLFHDQLRNLKPEDPGHESVSIADPATSRPAINPKTGAPYEMLLPREASRTPSRDPSGFAESVKRASAAGPPETPLDHLVLATLAWSLVENNPGVDTSGHRAQIQKWLGEALREEALRPPARYLRGVLRYVESDHAGARDDLAAVVAAQPAALGASYLLGVVLARTGEPKKACEILEAVARELSPEHPIQAVLPGHRALALQGCGEVDKAIGICEQWAARGAKSLKWQEVVIPRVVAAQIERKRGNLTQARELIVGAIRDEEALGQRKRALEGDPTTGSLFLLWEPAIKELFEICEATGDVTLVEEYREKLAELRSIEGSPPAIGKRKAPVSAQAWLDLNVAWLRSTDVWRKADLNSTPFGRKNP